MKPRWFDLDALPYEQMWPDDPHWIPLVLAGKKVIGKFALTENNTMIKTYELREVNKFS